MEMTDDYPEAIKYYEKGLCPPKEYKSGLSPRDYACACKIIKSKLEPCKLNAFSPFSGSSDIKNYEQIIKIFTETIYYSG